MPASLELPRMLRPVIPHMGRERLASFGRGIVNEFVALAFGHTVGGSGRLPDRCARLEPRFPAVVRALNDLSKPAAGLRRIDSIRVNWRTFDVINFPPGKMRAIDFPSFTLPVRCQNESALACPNQYSYSAHALKL